MIDSFTKYLQLLALIFRHGRLGHSGENFNRLREEALKDLAEFIPTRVAPPTFTYQPGILTNVVAQLAFVRNCFRTRGGHLLSKDVAYIRIPRSASTSMSKEMLEKKYSGLKQKVITPEQINFLTDINLTEDLDPSVPIFAIVRNPLRRLVSVYRDFFEKGTDHYIYRDYLFGILPHQLSFAEFIHRITRIPDRLKDQHIRPQHSFLRFYFKKKLEVKVFKLEEPTQLIRFLEAHAMQLPHLNKSDDEYDYRSYYTTLLATKAGLLYADDIRKFGYENEVKALDEYLKTVHK